MQTNFPTTQVTSSSSSIPSQNIGREKALAKLSLATQIGQKCLNTLEALPATEDRMMMRQWLVLCGTIFSDIQDRLIVLGTGLPSLFESESHLQSFVQPLKVHSNASACALEHLSACKDLTPSPAQDWLLGRAFVKQNKVANELHAYFSRLFSPATLDLSHRPDITDGELLETLSRLHAPIHRVNLAGCSKLSDKAILTLIEHCHQIVSLNVNDTQIKHETLLAFLPKIEDDSLVELHIDTGTYRLDDTILGPFVAKCRNDGLTSLSLNFWCLSKDLVLPLLLVGKCKNGGLTKLRLTGCYNSGVVSEFMKRASPNGITSLILPYKHLSEIAKFRTALQDRALSCNGISVNLDGEKLLAVLPKIRVESIKELPYETLKDTPAVRTFLSSIPDGSLERMSLLGDTSTNIMRLLLPKCRPGCDVTLPKHAPKDVIMAYISLIADGSKYALDLSKFAHADEDIVKAYLPKCCDGKVIRLNLGNITVSPETMAALQLKLAPQTEIKELVLPHIRSYQTASASS